MSPGEPAPTGGAAPAGRLDGPGGFRRVLVAFDGGGPSQVALEAAIRLCERFGAALTIATVPHGGGEDPILARLVPVTPEGKALGDLLEAAEAAARSRGVGECKTVYLKGEVVTALRRFLEKEPHDLVVVGSRGLSRGGRLLLGSVSTDLVNAVPTSVLIVRDAPTARTGASGPGVRHR
ncbi:MAG TPA: universal stress protein [Thermoplasmata archaeon]|nr:universal stress protein [Thermoplasmata archaeon]